jgi:uncharacterized membrane protein
MTNAPRDDEPLSQSAKGNLEIHERITAREHAQVSGARLWIERLSRLIGSPTYFLLVAAFIVAWIGINCWGMHAGWKHVDAPPFAWLQGIVSSNALLLTITVLIRQDRMSRLAEHRAHLDLQINLLTEQKVTKILQLVDEQRSRPRTAHRPPKDEQVAEMTKPADANAILDAIRHTEKEV